MGRLAGGCEHVSERLWSLADVHRWCSRLYRFPLFGHGVRRYHLFVLLTYGGPRRCVGTSHLIIACGRMKALVFTLVRGFEFELAVPPEEIVRKTSVVGRPVVASNPAAGPQLPLLIRLANTD